MTVVLIRWSCEDTEIHRERHVMMKAENGIKQMQAKECQSCHQPPEARKARKDSPTNFRGSMALPTP